MADLDPDSICEIMGSYVGNLKEFDSMVQILTKLYIGDTTKILACIKRILKSQQLPSNIKTIREARLSYVNNPVLVQALELQFQLEDLLDSKLSTKVKRRIQPRLAQLKDEIDAHQKESPPSHLYRDGEILRSQLVSLNLGDAQALSGLSGQDLLQGILTELDKSPVSKRAQLRREQAQRLLELEEEYYSDQAKRKDQYLNAALRKLETELETMLE